MTGTGLLSDGVCVFTHVLQLKDLPKPSFMSKTIEELAIGTYTKVISVSTWAFHNSISVIFAPLGIALI